LFLRLSHDFVPQSLCLALLRQRPIGPNFPDRLVHHRAMRLRNLYQAGALRFGFSKFTTAARCLKLLVGRTFGASSSIYTNCTNLP
jgi:hypothetical protein